MNLKLKGLMLGIIISVLIGGCVETQQNDKSVNTSVNTSTSTPFFPVQKDPHPTVQMTALLKGELVLVNGCLRVENYLLVWPHGFSISTDGKVIQIIDNTGKPIARVGDKIKLSGGGGEMPREIIANYSTELPSDRCSGPYWIVGEVITSD
jgi:hypothetical protein